MAIKKALTEKQYWAQNSNKSTDKSFLLLGEEELSKDEFITKTINSIFKDAEFQLSHFYSENAEDFNEFIEFSRSTMIFSTSKASVFYNIEKELINKTKKALFDELIENIPENTLLFFKSKSNTAPKQLKSDIIMPIIFWKPFENELTRYAISRGEDLNITIDFQSAQTLLNLTGRDKSKINDAVEKLFNFSIKDPITPALIKNILSNEREISIFEFIDSLFLKKNNILSLFKKLLNSGVHELVILEFIKREIIKLEKYYAFLKESSDIQKSISAAGINPKSKESFIEKVSFFNLEKIHKLVQNVYSIEFELKSGQSGKGLQNSLVSLIYNIVKI